MPKFRSRLPQSGSLSMEVTKLLWLIRSYMEQHLLEQQPVYSVSERIKPHIADRETFDRAVKLAPEAAAEAADAAREAGDSISRFGSKVTAFFAEEEQPRERSSRYETDWSCEQVIEDWREAQRCTQRLLRSAAT